MARNDEYVDKLSEVIHEVDDTQGCGEGFGYVYRVGSIPENASILMGG